jgi:tRNA G26 N,N-dimethylase Trm1
LSTIQGDLRQRVHDGGWQWLDIDPFGSPIPFLDAAIQSTSRRAVIEVTATDVAALVGSKRAAGLRRYGARVRLDGLAHDSGLRVLMANIAQICAKHDRGVEPLMSIWESHHLRVSLFIRRSAEGGNEVEKNIGWRIAEPTHAEIEASIVAGLHPFGSSEECVEAPTQPHALVPLSFPVDRNDARISGPLWIGPLHSSSIL